MEWLTIQFPEWVNKYLLNENPSINKQVNKQKWWLIPYIDKRDKIIMIGNIYVLLADCPRLKDQSFIDYFISSSQ